MNHHIQRFSNPTPHTPAAMIANLTGQESTEPEKPELTQFEVEILSEAYRNSQDPDYDKQYNYGDVYQSVLGVNTWEELKQLGLLTYATNRYWNITKKGSQIVRSLGA